MKTKIFSSALFTAVFLFTASMVQAQGWTVSGTNTYTSPLTNNVGIGIALPGANLDVQNAANSVIKVKTTSAGNNYSVFTAENNTAGVGFLHLMGGPGMTGILFGVGRANSGQLYTNNAPLVIGTATPQDLTLGTNSLANVTIKNGGNVGIGIPGPGYRLHVNGTGTYGELVSFQNSTYETFFMSKASNSSIYNPLVLANDNGIFWKDNGTINSANGFVIAPWADASNGIRISGNGNVGIGTSDPSLARLQVQTNTTINNTPDNVIGISAEKKTSATVIRRVTMVPHLTGWGFNQLSRDGDCGIIWSDGVHGGGQNETAGLVIAPWAFPNNGIRINANGNVGIGTALDVNPNNYKLAVNGTLGAKAVKVEVSSATWADYVFEKEYKLKSLEELEAFVATHKHLPNVPSAVEVEKDGIDMATMDAKLLEKIEELSLYIIEQNKRIEALEQKSVVEKSK